MRIRANELSSSLAVGAIGFGLLALTPWSVARQNHSAGIAGVSAVENALEGDYTGAVIDVVSFGAAGKSIQLGVKTLRASRALKTVKEPKMTIRGNRTRKAVSRPHRGRIRRCCQLARLRHAANICWRARWRENNYAGARMVTPALA